MSGFLVFLLLMPLTISIVAQNENNPLQISAADLIFVDGELQSIFGESVANIGDYNLDGYEDFIVGGRSWNEWQGKVWIYYGGENGLLSTDPAFTIIGEPHIQNSGSCFGHSVVGAVDVNNDGVSDFLAGGPGSWGGWEVGRIYTFLGNPNTLPERAGDDSFSNITSPNKYDWVGETLDLIGDFNGDGFPDLVTGAPGTPFYSEETSPYRFESGFAYVFFGDGEGIASVPGITLTNNVNNSDFAQDVGAGGDINGDGFDDLLVGARKFSPTSENDETGRSYLFFGQEANSLNREPDVAIDAPIFNSGFGYENKIIGDLNSDGFDDIAIGAFKNLGSDEETYVAIYFGGQDKTDFGTPDLLLNGFVLDDQFGRVIWPVGDVNNDGHIDLAIGAPGSLQIENEPGKVYIYFGGPSVDDTADIILIGEAGADRFGESIGYADVNSDGQSDIIIGATGHENGRVYIYGNNISRSATSTPVFGFTILSLILTITVILVGNRIRKSN